MKCENVACGKESVHCGLLYACRQVGQVLARESEHIHAEIHRYARHLDSYVAETDNAAAVTTLGLSPEVEALREANAAFEEAFDARNDEVSLQLEQRSISSADATAEANRLYQEIVQTVNAYAIVQPTDEINAFIDKLNGLTGSLASVSGGTASGGEAPDVPEPEPSE